MTNNNVQGSSYIDWATKSDAAKKDTTVSHVKELIHNMIYSADNRTTIDAPMLMMEEPVFDLIRREIYKQMTEIKERQDIVVTDALSGILIRDPSIGLLTLSLLPAVFNMYKHVYHVSIGGTYWGDVVYDGPFVVGPDSDDPSVLRMGAPCTTYPTS